MSRHASKRVLVTGGSKGIGYAIAHRFASLGASVTLLARSQLRLDRARDSLPSSVLAGMDQKHKSISGDVGDPALWEEIKRSEKDIDILINAAGITQLSYLVSTDIEVIHEILRTNLLGTTLACRAVGRNMLGRGKKATGVGGVRGGGGVIVNFSSVLALQKPLVGSAIYAASKAGVFGLTRTLAAELGPRGVRVNCITPGYIETDMTGAITDAGKAAAVAATPLRRFGNVEEVADAAVFLAECGFVNGTEILVDGGLSCT